MKLCLQFCWNIENHESNPNTSGLENISEVRYLFAHSIQTKCSVSLVCLSCGFEGIQPEVEFFVHHTEKQQAGREPASPVLETFSFTPKFQFFLRGSDFYTVRFCGS